MRLKQQWWRGLVAAVLGGLVSVTAVAATGAQFIPILGFREGALRALGIPQADGLIAYLTLLNERDGGIHGVPVVWEECETVYDVSRGIECYERLKAKKPTGARLLWAMVSPLRSPTRFTPGLWVFAVREWPEPGISLSHGALAVPGVTWFVATTFSPCPLAPERKYRLLRSPHDVGQVGTCPDAPLSRAVAREADPALPRCVGPGTVRPSSSSPRTFWTAPFRRCHLLTRQVPDR